MQGVASVDLTIEEITAIQASGRAPSDFFAIMQPAGQVQVQSVLDPVAGRVAIFQVVVVLTKNVLDLPTGGVLDAQGQNQANAKVQKAMPVPPMVRMVVDRALAGKVLQEMFADQAAKEMEENPRLVIEG